MVVMKIDNKYTLALLAFGCTLIGFGLGFVFKMYWSFGDEQFPVMSQAFDILKTHGLKAIPSEPAMEYGMIKGLVTAYDDPYTLFVEPAQHELESNLLQGSFGGIGVRISRDADGYIIFYPIQGSPAAEVGMLDGDRLLEIDREPVSREVTVEAVQASLRGPVGRDVTVTVGRPPEFSPLQFTIRRKEFSLPSVTWHLDVDDPHIGVVEINIIAASTSEEVLNAVRDLQTRGAKGFILDLRDNYGGLLTAGIDIARLFLVEGTILEQQDRNLKVDRFQVEKPGPLSEIPLVILVNRNTASAAEIIAGALKALQRAKVIGEPTFGKDTIQSVFDLQDQSSLHVTSARWWIPGLDPPVGQGGVQPDIEIPISPEDAGDGRDLFLQSAKKLLTKIN